MGLDDPASIDPARQWGARQGRERLRVPIGVSEHGDRVELDIKEAARNGMGPHGLCVGATGSGKSEFLRTLILGMIAAHPPEVLNLVLVDFKGGATFLGLDRARHVSAVITNLADEAHLVARMQDALGGEMNRSQELLRAAGNFANVADYERARSRGRVTWHRCPRCSSSSTSSPNCSASIRTSPTCSLRSDGWAARSACICCWPASGSTRAGCAGWRPTCPTGYA